MSQPLHTRTPSVPQARPHSGLTALRRLVGYLLVRRAWFLLTLACSITSTLLLVLAPWLTGRIIDQHAVAGEPRGLLSDCLVLLLVYMAATLFAWLQARGMASVAQDCVQRLRSQLFEHLQRLPMAFFAKHSQGELMSRATHDLDLLATTLNQGVMQLLSSLVLVLGALGFMLALSPALTLVSLCCLATMLIVTRSIARYSRRAITAQQTQLGALNGLIQESISGQATLRLSAAEAHAAARVEGIAQRLRSSSRRAQIIAGSMGPAMNTFNNLGFALLAAVGGWLALHGDVSVGAVIAFLGYSRQLERPVNELANQFNLMQAAIAGIERSFEILDQEDELADHQDRPVPPLTGAIRFEAVGFHYTADHPVLQGIDLQIERGERIALIGPTGAGKTTVFNLLLRFIEPSAGHILLDGHRLSTLPREGLRRQIGVVLQDCHLFNVSLRDNLHYGRPSASDEEILHVARLTGADDFIRQLPGGYESRLGTGGITLSQGQRQLLAITRTLLRDPTILLLDEATSNIDARSEQLIHKALQTLMHGRTSLIIAHRPETIRHADRIIVLEQGRVAASGTHAQLLESSLMYQRLQARPDPAAARRCSAPR
ncbi:ABC transporter ATP-binding protein [Pseudomonas sp. LRF_L74]|uniref:ABC transporter ATP-binding protein n=1 Tax=Pseudomonas sp. LRF_L74 TaxID=3369422 RepID=UPI003F609B5C